MEKDGKKERKVIHRDYLSNSNPYAFLDHYDPENALDAGSLAHLEATRRIQPEMTPLADIDCLVRENEVQTDKMINMMKNEVIEKLKNVLTKNNLEFDKIYRERTGMMSSESIGGQDIYEFGYNDEIIFNILEEYQHIVEIICLYDEYLRISLYKKQRRLHEKVFKGFNDVLASKRYVPKEIDLPIPKEISNLSEALVFKTIVDRYKEELQQAHREKRTFINSHILECYGIFLEDKKKKEEVRNLHYECVKKLKDSLAKDD